MNDLLGGKYRLGQPLGRGGMGMVYEAVQEDLGRRVALKLLDPRLAEDREQLERFRREAEIVAALGHPNAVQVTDFQYEPQPFLVMELLRGESLGSLIDREHTLSPQRVAFIAAQALSALAAAHRAGVVHRDVKPDNIFLLADAAVPDTVKVLDFGIAKLSIEGQAKLTGTGTMLGTPAFMAPEQARGESDVDARADVYAVGATMYQALTGRFPHEAASIPALLFAIVEKTPAPLRELRPDVPAELASVIERAMAKDRAARFPDADAMRAALAPWSGLPASTSAPVHSSGVSPTAATVATPMATPIAVSRTPAPEPAPAASNAPAVTQPAAAPRAPWTAIAVVVAAAILAGAGIYVSKSMKGTPAAPVASTSASVVASAAPSTTSSAPPVTSQAPVVASAAPSVSAAPVVVEKKKRYCGTNGYLASTSFDCPECDHDTFRNDMGMQVPAISRCFAASVHEPPIHENVGYDFAISDTGAMKFVEARGGTPTLDRCLARIVEAYRMKMKSPKGGTVTLTFTGECKPGYWGACD